MLFVWNALSVELICLMAEVLRKNWCVFWKVNYNMTALVDVWTRKGSTISLRMLFPIFIFQKMFLAFFMFFVLWTTRLHWNLFTKLCVPISVLIYNLYHHKTSLVLHTNVWLDRNWPQELNCCWTELNCQVSNLDNV